MSKKYGTKTLMVVDNGLFIPLAHKLSEDFGRVLYWSPWVCAFPKTNAMRIGDGVPGVERIDYLWDYVDETDCFMFPDIYFGDIQNHLVDLGKRVFGSKKGDELELYRDTAKELFSSLGLLISPYEVVTGVENLRKYLKSHERQWVKINVTRGDGETFFAKNYRSAETRIDEMEYALGSENKHTKEFIVEEDLPDEGEDGYVEIGYDGICIDGEYPDVGMCGIEVKSLGYVGAVRKYSEMPKELTDFTDTISGTLKEYGYRNVLSTENRVNKKHESYMIDLCPRCGSPPSELYQNMITNFADIVWNGADGKLVQPEYRSRFGVEVMLHSPLAEKSCMPIWFPEKYSDQVKLCNWMVEDGKNFILPQSLGISKIGSVVADGDSVTDITEEAMEICKQIEGYYIDIPEGALGKAKEEFDKLADFGIDLGVEF
jgi:hypothetical protein